MNLPSDPGRSVGLWGATAIGIGGMIGGGIFAVLGVVAEQAGGGAPLALAVGGLLALLTASSYALLCTRYPSRGGSVVFVDRVFGTSLATGALNNLLWFGYLVALALYATAFASYAEALFVGSGSVSPWVDHLLISAAILIPTAINLASAGSVARAETALVVVKLLILGLVGVAGFASVHAGRLAVSTWPSIPTVVAAGLLVFIAYEGFELIANAAEDVRDPRRTLPRAYHLAVGFVVALYVAVALVAVGAVPSATLVDAKDYALAVAARPSLGEAGFALIAVAAMLSTASAINASLYGAARVSFVIARSGELPEALERKVWNRPIEGLLITGAATLVLANLVPLASIAAVGSAGFLLIFTFVNVANARLAGRSGARRSVAWLAAGASAAAFAALLVQVAREHPAQLWFVAGLSVLAFGGERLYRSVARRRPPP